MNKIVRILGVVGTATRREHEPWMWDVRVKLTAEQEREMRDIPGCGFDGLRKVWVLPEEIMVIMEARKA